MKSQHVRPCASPYSLLLLLLLPTLQAAWHPSSPSHFAALASDNRWRLYHTSRLTEAEQTFALRLPGIQQSVGLRRGAIGASTSSSSGSGLGLPPRLTSFAFGPASSGWASLLVLFLASNGGVYLLCPVAPFGMRVAASALQRLMDGSSDSTAHAWLLVSLQVELRVPLSVAVSFVPYSSG
jgi:nuclear pore complex protein Nup88